VGKKKSKSTTTNEPPKWARPHLEGAANSISGVVSGNQGNLDSIAGGIRGFLPGLGERAFGANAGLDAATGYATDVLGGKYLENNPYIDQMASLARGNTMDQINSSFSKSGRVGSALHGHDLGRGISEAELGLRYQNYGNERNAMTQAAGMMPALNQSQYAGVMPYLAAAQTAGTLPYSGIQNLGQIGGLFGGYGTQSSTQPGGWGQGLLGAAGAALPFILSEPEAKTNIELLRREPDGLGWYKFAYKRDPGTMLEGVMADEVEKLRPHALGPRLANGWRTVNYAKLSEAP
jgi:hypothetical protein